MPDTNYWEESPGFLGYASTLPTDAQEDVIEELHKVVEEVTGKPVDKPPPRRIGFVW